MVVRPDNDRQELENVRSTTYIDRIRQWEAHCNVTKVGGRGNTRTVLGYFPCPFGAHAQGVASAGPFRNGGQRRHQAVRPVHEHPGHRRSAVGRHGHGCRHRTNPTAAGQAWDNWCAAEGTERQKRSRTFRFRQSFLINKHNRISPASPVTTTSRIARVGLARDVAWRVCRTSASSKFPTACHRTSLRPHNIRR